VILPSLFFKAEYIADSDKTQKELAHAKLTNHKAASGDWKCPAVSVWNHKQEFSQHIQPHPTVYLTFLSPQASFNIP
jgi:hypothetical protein